MSALKERIIYLKLVEGVIEDSEMDGRWIDVFESDTGGAKVKIAIDDLEVLEKLNMGMQKMGIDVEMEVIEEQNMVIFVDKNGVEIPFGCVVKAVYGVYN